MVITLTVILPQLTPIKNLNFLEIKLFQLFGYFFFFRCTDRTAAALM